MILSPDNLSAEIAALRAVMVRLDCRTKGTQPMTKAGWYRDFKFYIQGAADCERFSVDIYAPDWAAAHGQGHDSFELANWNKGASRALDAATASVRAIIEGWINRLSPQA